MARRKRSAFVRRDGVPRRGVTTTTTDKEAESAGRVEEEDDDDGSSSASVYDSADEEVGPGYGSGSGSGSDGSDSSDGVASGGDDDDATSDDDASSSSDDASSSSDDGFEDQGSSDSDDDVLREQAEEDDSGDDGELEILDGGGDAFDSVPRRWRDSLGLKVGGKRPKGRAPGKAETRGGEEGDGGGVDGGGGDGGDPPSSSSPTGVATPDPATALWMHADDLSSDDDDDGGTGNRIGRVPLHWYDEYDHIGYDARGEKVIKSIGKTAGEDGIDRALKLADNADAMGKGKGKFMVHDALNARDVTLTPRQVELIRRVQGGAFAHPEHDAHPDYVDYYSGIREVSGLNSGAHPPKARFQPSKWEKLQVRRLLHRLKCGSINMDFLEGRVRDMNDLIKPKEGSTDKPFLLWKGDEEDELALRKGPQHIPAPKLPPPGHAESYVPPDEYLPTEDDLKEWEDMDPKDRPHGLLIPRRYPNLRSVGAYEHSVRERFERCLDLYLCPRTLKRRLNIDPESLVPSLPRAADLRPFPTARAIEYVTPHNEEEAPMVRCLAASPDGQFLASGASDGSVRLWEVQTGRLLRSWDISEKVCALEERERERQREAEAADKGEMGDEGEGKGEEEREDEDAAQGDGGGPPKPTPKSVVALEWNPNRSHHCLIAAAGKCTVVIATGTGGIDDGELTEALLAAAAKCRGGGNVTNEKARRAVRWFPLRDRSDPSKDAAPVSAFGGASGPVCALRTNRDVTSLRWHRKGDYFVTVSPKAGAAAVLIHQLSKAASQQPFGKAKDEAQVACFHPSKPFLFVASRQHVRVYHLVKQAMAKRLMSGCRHISSMDVHPSGDHVIVGSLDRRVVWFDLDLSSTPYRTLKYHERALRSVSYHRRYPLMASSSDDGTVHVFHSTVYTDLMRNPLIVPVKVLRGHSVVRKLGVLSFVFHPSQPWLFSAGADGKIYLYQDI